MATQKSEIVKNVFKGPVASTSSHGSNIRAGDTDIRGFWASKFGECHIFDGQATGRLCYTEFIEDGSQFIFGWLQSVSDLSWEASLSIYEKGQQPWYQPSGATKPEVSGEILVEMLPGTPPLIRTQCKQAGSEGWEASALLYLVHDDAARLSDGEFFACIEDPNDLVGTWHTSAGCFEIRGDGTDLRYQEQISGNMLVGGQLLPWDDDWFQAEVRQLCLNGSQQVLGWFRVRLVGKASSSSDSAEIEFKRDAIPLSAYWWHWMSFGSPPATSGLRQSPPDNIFTKLLESGQLDVWIKHKEPSDASVYEHTQIGRWFSLGSTSPCVNKVLPHKDVLRLEPFRQAVDKFLCEDAKTRISRDDVEMAARHAEAAILSEDPSAVKTALVALAERLNAGRLEMKAWQDAVSHAGDVMERLQQRSQKQSEGSGRTQEETTTASPSHRHSSRSQSVAVGSTGAAGSGQDAPHRATMITQMPVSTSELCPLLQGLHITEV